MSVLYPGGPLWWSRDPASVWLGWREAGESSWDRQRSSWVWGHGLQRCLLCVHGHPETWLGVAILICFLPSLALAML